MKETRLMMGMPITLEVADPDVSQATLDEVFEYFQTVDDRFSTYKDTSEVSMLNRGELSLDMVGAEMRTILALSEETKRETDGYFDIWRDGRCDPSGLVKGWAIRNAANLLAEAGWLNYAVDAGGDIQVAGLKEGRLWRVGIRNPFNRHEHVKALALTDCGVATSGTAIRGQHIFNPHDPERALVEIVSMTVIGPDIYEADRFATAAFAMGASGIQFIQTVAGLEGYMIDAQGRATYTRGFERYVLRVC